MEIMSTDGLVWEDHHHRSSFLPNASSIDFDLVSLISIDIFSDLQTPVLLQDIDSEGNIFNITNTTPIVILFKPETVEHIHVGQNCSTKETENFRDLFKEFHDIFAWTYEDILGIDPSIVVHKIKTYPTANLVRQKLRQVRPRKEATIKAKVDKLFKARFIYPIPLMEWVSNIVPVNKK